MHHTIKSNRNIILVQKYLQCGKKEFLINSQRNQKRKAPIFQKTINYKAT
jgi:hypothetical protein